MIQNTNGLIELPWIPAELDHETSAAPDDTQRLAQECYTRVTFGDERDHDVKRDEWADLPPETRARWCAALAPLAMRLAELEHLQGQLQDARMRLNELAGEHRRDAPCAAAVVAA